MSVVEGMKAFFESWRLMASIDLTFVILFFLVAAMLGILAWNLGNEKYSSNRNKTKGEQNE